MKQLWVQNKTKVSDGNIELEVGSQVKNYSVTVGGKTYGDGDWCVLGAKDGKLLITTNENVKTSSGEDTVQLSGQDEYVNGITTLNSAVSNYGNSNYSEGNARSINVEDINRVTGYTPDVAEYNRGENVSQWNNEVIYTRKSDNKIWYKGTIYPTAETSSEQTSFTYYTGAGWKTLNTGETAKIKQTLYKYYPQTLTANPSTATSINGSSRAYSLLFANPSSYWLGSQGVYTSEGVVAFAIYRVADGYIFGSTVYNSGRSNT